MASLISIILIMSLKGRIDQVATNKYICRIGKNAIWFYYTQGIGASILYFIRDYIPEIYWFVKWLILGVVNIVITILLAELILALYKLSGKLWLTVKQKVLKDIVLFEQI